ncbi:hypothetical protein XBO1_290083 [Xenorhabdus bovienii str. oregonense]|uniref:Insertion element IS402-like domain-containing protein n=1 Tax=Xenorhabdus bovienii str. oregonense TaxID=1398202 RepID=A0A077P8M9_XENBV|nr:transposase [Xenorhabdus bovienii]CDH07490.1 hypothetical protein XBO1_290083 [Xenorhabdus bovienii str. oregonense]
MNTPSHRRHDISEHIWNLLEPHLPGRKGAWGREAQDNRLFINAVFWILRTGSPWRDLPPDYGGWKNTHRRFCRWRDKGVWEALLEQLIRGYDSGTSGTARHEGTNSLSKKSQDKATRYAKNSASFLAVVKIRCLARWLNIS